MESDETIENDKILDQRESKSNESSSKASRVTKPPVLLIQNGKENLFDYIIIYINRVYSKEIVGSIMRAMTNVTQPDT